jgi:DNA-binding CsgD family transcriptional regulator
MSTRFWTKVDRSQPEGCWLWTASRNAKGYGHVQWAGSCQQAHRVSWMIAHGSIPDGLFVLHRCDVRNCVNPAHLFLGTNADNMADMVAKGRGRGASRPGEMHGASKISDATRREIAARLAAGARGVDIAREYGLSKSYVSQLRLRGSAVTGIRRSSCS